MTSPCLRMALFSVPCPAWNPACLPPRAQSPARPAQLWCHLFFLFSLRERTPASPQGARAEFRGRSLTSTALLLQFPASSISPAPLGSSCRPTTRRITATTSTAFGSSWLGPRAASTWPSMTSTWSLSSTSWSSRMGPPPRPQCWAPSQETSSPPPSPAAATWPASSSRLITPQGREASTSLSPVSPPSVPSWPSL